MDPQYPAPDDRRRHDPAQADTLTPSGNQDETLKQDPAGDTAETVKADPADGPTAATRQPPDGSRDPGTLLTENDGGSAGDATMTAATGPGTPPVTAADDDPLIGQVLAGVKIERRIGAGGMGAVYLGRHETLAIEVALKLLHPKASDAERFLREARSAAKVKHPNVVGVQNAGRDGERLYIVMDLVPGGDLNQELRTRGKLPWRVAVDAMRQAAAGLGAAHAAGIVHRDVKLGNLLRAADGTVQVADLGLAKERDADIELTKSGAIMGTPAYMAPEQAKDSRHAGPPADVYALGVSLWMLVTGELPFKGETSTQVILAHINDPLPDLRSRGGAYPDGLIALLERFLAKDPAKRPQDGAAAAAELQALLDADGAADATTLATTMDQPARDADTPRGSGHLGRLLALVGIVALAVAVGWLAMRGGEQTPPAGVATDQPAPPTADPAAAPPAAAAAAQEPADSWQTPPRAVFVQSPADLALTAELDQAALDTGLRLIERRAIEAMIQEQDLQFEGRIDPATASRLGRLIGGHLALIAEPTGAGLHLRVVEIETGAITGSKVVDPAEAASVAQAMLVQAAASLPARGRLHRLPDDSFEIDLGRRHGLQPGERLTVHPGEPEEPGTAIAVVTVAEPGDSRSAVTLAGTAPEALPALVQRRAP